MVEAGVESSSLMHLLSVERAQTGELRELPLQAKADSSDQLNEWQHPHQQWLADSFHAI